MNRNTVDQWRTLPTGRTAGGIDAGLRGHMLHVYNLMAGGLALTGLVAYVAATSGLYAAVAATPLFWILVFAPLVLALLLGFRLRGMSVGAARAAFWGYATLLGLSLAGIFLVYTGTSIARTFFIAAATFAAMSIYGYTTRTDLSRFGSFLIMGMVGIVLAGIVNIFLASSVLAFGVSVMGVVVFTGLAAWDTQRIREMYFETAEPDGQKRAAVLGALMLYMDFVNLFLSLLNLTGERRA